VTDAIIGATGFVGTNLCAQHDFTGKFHSRNISKIAGKAYDIVVCAAAPATMWAANKDPDGDLHNIHELLSHIERVDAERFVLISTIAVLAAPAGLDEATDQFETAKAYGRNRRFLEEACTDRFPRIHILRLPALFGTGLKKNFIYDILNPVPSFLTAEKFAELADRLAGAAGEVLKRVYTYADNLKMYGCQRELLTGRDRTALTLALQKAGFTATNFTHADSVFQFYALSRLWSDIGVVLNNDVALVHLAPEPLRAGDVFRTLTGAAFESRTAAVYREDMRSMHTHLWNRTGAYIEDRQSVLANLKAFHEENMQS